MLKDTLANRGESQTASGWQVVDNRMTPTMEPEPPTASGSPLPWVGLAAAGVLSMTIATPIAARGGVRAALSIGEIALAAPTLLGLLLLAPPTAAWWATTRFRFGDTLISVTGGLALWITSLGLFGLQTIVWPPPPIYLEAFQALHLALRPDGPTDALLSLAAVSLAPAMAEELVFRGALLISLGRRFGEPAAVVLTALAFGSIHLDLVGGTLMMHRIPFAILIGLGLAMLRVRTGSLAAPVLAHATVNALTFGAVILGLDDTGAQPSQDVGRAAILLLGGGAAIVALLTLRRTQVLGSPKHPM